MAYAVRNKRTKKVQWHSELRPVWTAEIYFIYGQIVFQVISIRRGCNSLGNMERKKQKTTVVHEEKEANSLLEETLRNTTRLAGRLRQEEFQFELAPTTWQCLVWRRKLFIK